MFNATVNVRLDFSHLLEIAPQLAAIMRGGAVQIIPPSAPAVSLEASAGTPTVASPALPVAAVDNPVAENPLPPADLTRRGRGRPKAPTSDIPTVAANPPKHDAPAAAPAPAAIPGFDEPAPSTDKPDPTPASPEEIAALKRQCMEVMQKLGQDGWGKFRDDATKLCTDAGAKFDLDQYKRIVLATLSKGALQIISRLAAEAAK